MTIAQHETQPGSRGGSSLRGLENREREPFDPRSIAVTTATRYPGWKPRNAGQLERGLSEVDGIRGDLALLTLQSAALRGFQVIIVDSPGSSPAFKEALENLQSDYDTIQVYEEAEKSTMSAGRRLAFEKSSQLQSVKVISWIEPEKISMIGSLAQAAKPIIDGVADIVVPARNGKAFESYPNYQKDFEMEGNKEFNELLRSHHLVPQDAPFLDVWFGPRLFKNDPDITKLFMHTWELDYTSVNKKNKEKAKNENRKMNPELWPNATFLPLVAALEMYHRRGEEPRIISVPIEYEHPELQTASEIANTDPTNGDFIEKRKQQLDNILGATNALIFAFEYDRGILEIYEGMPVLKGGATIYTERDKLLE